MRLLSTLFRIDPKKKELKRISMVLGNVARNTVDPVSVMMNTDYDENDRAKEEFLTLCESEDATRALLEEFGVTRPDLAKLYATIIEIGGGQWRRKHFVPVSALADPRTLHYILQTLANSEGDEESLTEMVYNLLMYFQKDRSSMIFSKTNRDHLLE